jgi:hypothetical protein
VKLWACSHTPSNTPSHTPSNTPGHTPGHTPPDEGELHVPLLAADGETRLDGREALVVPGVGFMVAAAG